MQNWKRRGKVWERELGDNKDVLGDCGQTQAWRKAASSEVG